MTSLWRRPRKRKSLKSLFQNEAEITYRVYCVDRLTAMNRPHKRYHKQNIVKSVRRGNGIADHCIYYQRKVHEPNELEILQIKNRSKKVSNFTNELLSGSRERNQTVLCVMQRPESGKKSPLLKAKLFHILFPKRCLKTCKSNLITAARISHNMSKKSTFVTALII